MSASAIGRRNSPEERRRLVAESLRVANPGNSARELPAQADPRQDCQIELSVDEIEPYDHNPRRAANPKYEEIKESIRACGIRNPLTVTRRPGEQRFIVEGGGNTRLAAMQALWAETRDVRFQKLTVMFRPWRSERHVLTAHLIENEQRGDLTFWDKACGVAALKTQLDAEKGGILTLRDLERELKSIGMSVNTATLTHYLFAIERLRILGEADVGLTGLDVKVMQPRLNLLKRYGQMRAALAEDDLYAGIVDPAFREYVEQCRQGHDFNATVALKGCEEALARHLQEPVTELRSQVVASAKPLSGSVSPAETTGKNLGRVGPNAFANTTQPDARSHPDADSGSVSSSKAAEQSTASDAAMTALQETLNAEVRRFAALASVSDCVVPDVKAPRGYSMQALCGADVQDARKRFAWDLLAALSGQQRELASTSTRDSAEVVGGTGGDCEEDETYRQCAVDSHFVDWMLDTHDDMAAAFCKIIVTIRNELANAGLRHSNEIPASLLKE